MKVLVKKINQENETVIQFPILPRGNGWQSSEGMPLSILESGKQGILLEKIIEAVRGARDFICMQSFLIEDTALIDALVEARRRGVRIFVLSSVEARIKDIAEEPEWNQKAREAYIQMLEKKFKYHFLFRSANQFHAKYILIDPKTHPTGFLCTNNFTRKGFLENVELAVKLSAEQVEELFKVFVYHFWEHAEDEHTDRQEFLKVTPAGRFSPPELRHILLTSPNPSLNTLMPALLEAIQRAEKSISVSTFQLDRNHPLVSALRAQAKKGVSVRLFTWPGAGYFQEHLTTLLTDGIEVYLNPRTHAKSLLIDGKEGYLFTANLKEEGLNRGMEVGLRLNPRQTEHLLRIHEWWSRDFEKKAVPQLRAKEIEQRYYVFDRGMMKELRLRDEMQEKSKKIKKVSELIDFFSQVPPLTDPGVRSRTLHLKAEIEDLPPNIPISRTGRRFEILDLPEDVRTDQDKSKKEKVRPEERDKKQAGKESAIVRFTTFLVLYDDFDIEEDLDKLRKTLSSLDLPVYYAGTR